MARANASAVVNSIFFNYPNLSTGEKRIIVLSNFLELTSNIIIDASSQKNQKQKMYGFSFQLLLIRAARKRLF